MAGLGGLEEAPVEAELGGTSIESLIREAARRLHERLTDLVVVAIKRGGCLGLAPLGLGAAGAGTGTGLGGEGGL